MVNLAAPLLAACFGMPPWAETPALVRKASDPSFSAVVTSEEILQRDFAAPSPRPDDRDPPHPGQWRWLGRSVPALDPREPDSSWQAGFGNEVGDALFRECAQEHPVNRNPAMSLDASTPRVLGWRAGIQFDQVDHFSDRLLPLRSNLLGNPTLTDQDASTRRAFIGENIPGHSFLGLGTASEAFAAAGRTGWIWLSSPGTGDPQCWRASTLALRATGTALSWSHAEGVLERADLEQGTVHQSQGWIAAGPFMDAHLSARGGFSYGRIGRSDEVAWHPREDLSLQPWLELSGGGGNWHFGGFHTQGTDAFLLRDSAGWSEDAGPIHLSALVGATLTNRPDGTAPWTDSSSAGIVRMDSRALEQTWFARIVAGCDFGPATVTVLASPWSVVHPRAFVPDSFDTIAIAGTAPWIVRAGSERPLDGVLLGWKQSLALQARIAEGAILDAEARFDPVLGGPAGQVDLVPPLWAFSTGARLHHRSGLSIHPVLLWRDKATIRHRSSDDWTVPSGFDANLWLDQSYFDDRLVFSMAALNMLSEDAVQAPNGAEDRFRMLVRVSGRLP